MDTLKDSYTWQPLGLMTYYRLAIAFIFLIMFASSWTHEFIEYSNRGVFFSSTMIYLAGGLFFLYLKNLRAPGFTLQVAAQTLFDIVMITTMMHAGGGVESGLGMLLIIHIASVAILLARRIALLFAAIASLVILGEQVYSVFAGLSSSNAYPQAGILGMLFFATSALASTLAKRLKESEALAAQRSVDLAHLEKLNELIIRNMRTGILAVDAHGRIHLANDAARSLLGQPGLNERDELSCVSSHLHKRLQEWKKHPRMQQKPIRQGQDLPDLQPGFSQLDPAQGDESGILVFLEDAAQLTHRFQQVKLASLGRLTASIAHEIRNPLGAIKYAAQLLNESVTEPGDRKLAGIINTQAQRMNRIIENVLQLSRQEQGTPETIQLTHWLSSFKSEFCTSQSIDKSQLDIMLEPQECSVLFDPYHLHQIMWNLCSNAINHYNKPTESLQIRLVGGRLGAEQQVYLDIIDNGPGISQDNLQQIFDPFFTTNIKGTGLGLYITKEIVEINRAKIKYISRPEGGSCFRIIFLVPA